jgi:hypothetical protein
MKQPVQTLEAVLPSAGYNYRRPTRHTYIYSEPLTLLVDGKPATGLAHYFRCEETGVSRRWGFDVTFAKDTGGN